MVAGSYAVATFPERASEEKREGLQGGGTRKDEGSKSAKRHEGAGIGPIRHPFPHTLASTCARENEAINCLMMISTGNFI
jgi:hypothetical protein